MIHPVILSTGTKRLFATAPRRTLTLVGSVTFPTDVVVQTYHPAPASAEQGQAAER